MFSARAFFALTIVALAGCSGPANVSAVPPVPAAAAKNPSVRIDVPPRFQWKANFGYCGETSLISAGLYYGQYASQYTVRALASHGMPQYLRKSQLLLGVNAKRAAVLMHLVPIVWDTARERDDAEFLRWAGRNLQSGYPVTIGVYLNHYQFYSSTNPYAGDAVYDHIVPVIAVTANTITFSDNGLWGPQSPARVPYSFTYRRDRFVRDRREANAPAAPVYSLPAGGANYGIAIAGVADRLHETLPVRVATNLNYEFPAMKNDSNVRPRPMPLTLTVTVSGLHRGTDYTLYRYDSFSSVPDERFNAHAARAGKRWPIRISSGSTYVVHERILSDRMAIYRAVANSSP